MKGYRCALSLEDEVQSHRQRLRDLISNCVKLWISRANCDFCRWHYYGTSFSDLLLLKDKNTQVTCNTLCWSICKTRKKAAQSCQQQKIVLFDAFANFVIPLQLNSLFMRGNNLLLLMHHSNQPYFFVSCALRF